MRPQALLLACALLTGSPVAADSIPALLSGQSNACLLSPYLPPGSHVLVCQNSTGIRGWDLTLDSTLAPRFARAVADHHYRAFVWYGNESDGDDTMSFTEVAARLSALYYAVRAPMIIIEITDPTGVRTHAKAAHAYAATYPTVALIRTSDLTFDGDHLTPEGYAIVAQRVIACYRAQCWRTQ